MDMKDVRRKRLAFVNRFSSDLKLKDFNPLCNANFGLGIVPAKNYVGFDDLRILIFGEYPAQKKKNYATYGGLDKAKPVFGNQVRDFPDTGCCWWKTFGLR